ncbi:hypothetical protein D3C76_1699140 [compost metagenome]
MIWLGILALMVFGSVFGSNVSMGVSPRGLGVTKVAFHGHGERVLPLGVGAVFVGGCDPEGFEFEQ